MKFKYIFPLLFIAMLALMTSCDEDETATLLDEVQVSSSYVALPIGGGSTKITVTAQDSWTAEKVTTDKNKVEWLTISASSGSDGESELTFSAPSAIDGRTAEVLIKSGGKTQRIIIMQGLAKISKATVAEAKAAPDGKTLRITGVATSIVNTEYGNWYLTDDTGALYIYGTLDKKGGTKNFMSLGLELGDEVTIEGPKSSYNGIAQMVNVMVISIKKSLVKVDSVKNQILPIEGGEFIAHLSVKGQGVSVDIPENAKSWLSISSITSTKEKAVVKFKAAPNTGGDRATTIIFRTTDGSKTYTTETTLSQKGAIVKATVAEFNAAVVGGTQYRLSGVISKVTDAAKGRFNLKDFSGETYVYGLSDFEAKGLKAGDIITIVGKRAEYNGPQVAGAVLESFIPVTPATIAEVLSKDDSKEIYYMVTGKITTVAHEQFGRLYLKQGDSEVYVYGCTPGYGAAGADRDNLLAKKGIKAGDTLTVIATKGSYGGVAQLNSGIYFSHVSGE